MHFLVGVISAHYLIGLMPAIDGDFKRTVIEMLATGEKIYAFVVETDAFGVLLLLVLFVCLVAEGLESIVFGQGGMKGLLVSFSSTCIARGVLYLDWYFGRMLKPILF